jgi:selenium metabolism protein YedF
MGKVVVISSDGVGSGSDELGRVLMRNFLYSLARAAAAPSLVFMVNSGVKLACEGSESLDDLFLMVENGVPVYSCGTCLDYLQLTGQLKAGGVGKMPDLVAQMMDAEDVVTVG